jgi:hypothetical protein
VKTVRAMYEPDDEDLAAEEQAASLKVTCRDPHDPPSHFSDVFLPRRTRDRLGRNTTKLRGLGKT